MLKISLFEVTEEWNIPFTKMHAIVTDNGSNMVKAFSTYHEEDNDNLDEHNIDCHNFDIVGLQNIY